MRFLILLSLLSCGSEIIIEAPQVSPEVVYIPPSVMICHNPSSSLHQTICSEECFKLGTVEAFCWEMPTDWCHQENLESWVDKVCISIREQARQEGN
jgi:hypothetical protein